MIRQKTQWGVKSKFMSQQSDIYISSDEEDNDKEDLEVAVQRVEKASSVKRFYTQNGYYGLHSSSKKSQTSTQFQSAHLNLTNRSRINNGIGYPDHYFNNSPRIFSARTGKFRIDSSTTNKTAFAKACLSVKKFNVSKSKDCLTSDSEQKADLDHHTAKLKSFIKDINSFQKEMGTQNLHSKLESKFKKQSGWSRKVTIDKSNIQQKLDDNITDSKYDLSELPELEAEFIAESPIPESPTDSYRKLKANQRVQSSKTVKTNAPNSYRKLNTLKNPKSIFNLQTSLNQLKQTSKYTKQDGLTDLNLDKKRWLSKLVTYIGKTDPSSARAAKETFLDNGKNGKNMTTDKYQKQYLKKVFEVIFNEHALNKMLLVKPFLYPTSSRDNGQVLKMLKNIPDGEPLGSMSCSDMWEGKMVYTSMKQSGMIKVKKHLDQVAASSPQVLRLLQENLDKYLVAESLISPKMTQPSITKPK